MLNFRVLRGLETLPYLDWLNKLYLREEHTNESLGFVPKQAYERDAPYGRIWIALLDSEPIGFIYSGVLAHGKDTRIHQACIDFDIRRRHYGALMVAELMQASRLAGSNGVSLRCGFDLEANSFWSEVGFYVCAYAKGGLRRNRILNIWRTDFVTPLLEHPRLVPARGERDASLWRKYKERLHLMDVSRANATWEQLLPILEERA